MKEISKNPESAKEILEKEIEKVDEEIKKLSETIEATMKNKTFTTNTWNGWGFN